MADKTKVEWADATITPFPGCSDALMPDGSTSPACRECYAKRVAARMSTNPVVTKYHGLALFRDGQPEWTGEVGYAPQDLDKVRGWTRPRRIFVESMGDIAHESLTPERWRPFWDLLEDNANRKQPHTFYLLTKRPAHLRFLLEAMRRDACMMQEPGKEPVIDEEGYWRTMAWVVCMTTTENQAAADFRVPELLRCPALHFGVSAEPLVGPLDLRPWLRRPCTCPDPGKYRGSNCRAKRYGLPFQSDDWCSCRCHDNAPGWVIAGAWSGPKATPSHPQWFRSLRDQAAEASTPFLMKQWGEWQDGSSPGHRELIVLTDGSTCENTKTACEEHARLIGGSDVWSRRGPCVMARVGKRVAGRLLDGVEHNGFPVVGPAQ